MTGVNMFHFFEKAPRNDIIGDFSLTIEIYMEQVEYPLSN